MVMPRFAAIVLRCRKVASGSSMVVFILQFSHSWLSLKCPFSATLCTRQSRAERRLTGSKGKFSEISPADAPPRLVSLAERILQTVRPTINRIGSGDCPGQGGYCTSIWVSMAFFWTGALGGWWRLRICDNWAWNRSERDQVFLSSWFAGNQATNGPCFRQSQSTKILTLYII